VPTALQALGIAVPQLRQRHPEGLVMGISGSTRVFDSRVVGSSEYLDYVRDWVLDVWAPGQRRRIQYPVRAGVLHDAGTSSTIPPGDLAHIVALADEQIPTDVMDSDRAIVLADVAGAAEFKQEAGAILRTIDLSGKLDGSLIWELFYSKLGSPLDRLVIELDARAGNITLYRDYRRDPAASGTPRAAG
jgi:hypothetical protein